MSENTKVILNVVKNLEEIFPLSKSGLESKLFSLDTANVILFFLL